MEKFKKYLYQNLHWILIVISLILISLGYYFNDQENLIDDILRNVGYSIIGT
jgi:hypothetical protein